MTPQERANLYLRSVEMQITVAKAQSQLATESVERYGLQLKNEEHEIKIDEIKRQIKLEKRRLIDANREKAKLETRAAMLRKYRRDLQSDDKRTRDYAAYAIKRYGGSVYFIPIERSTK